MEDASGALWIGTAQGGLNRLDRSREAFHVYRNSERRGGLNSDFILSLHEDRSGILWVGTYGGGLNRCDPRKAAFRLERHDPLDIHSLSHNAVTSFSEASEDHLWVGTMNGLNRFNRRQGTNQIYRKTDREPESHQQ